MVERIRKLRAAAEKKMRKMRAVSNYEVSYMYGKKGNWPALENAGEACDQPASKQSTSKEDEQA